MTAIKYKSWNCSVKAGAVVCSFITGVSPHSGNLMFPRTTIMPPMIFLKNMIGCKVTKRQKRGWLKDYQCIPAIPMGEVHKKLPKKWWK